MSAVPSAAEATYECNRAAAVGQFSIQQPWLRFLEVHILSAQTYCVTTQKVELWDLIWTSVPFCRQSPSFRTKSRGNTYLPFTEENNNQTECRALFPSIPWKFTLQPFFFFFWPCCRFLHIMTFVESGEACTLSSQLKVVFIWFIYSSDLCLQRHHERCNELHSFWALIKARHAVGAARICTAL